MPDLVGVLSTAPNAGIPVGFRKRMPNGDEKLSAAGILFVTPAGDGLFLKRKGAGHAGEWSIPAGKIEQDEEPSDAARREAIEEVGRLPKWELVPLHRETSADGIDFATFGQRIDDRFDPVLNDESADYVWAPLNDPPQPLHPGLAKVLAQFFAEEAAEPEHMQSGAAHELEKEFAGDAALSARRVPLALDRNSVRTFDKDGRLHISETNVCKACVSPYRGSEIPGWEALGLEPDRIYQMLRPPEELEKAAPTINGLPLLRKHIPVSADDHQPWDVAGATGTNARWDDPFIKNGLTVWVAEDIEGVENETKCELSPGYHYVAVMEPGTFGGEAYDGRMTQIVFNHLAIVEEGRQGPDVVIGDALSEMQWALIESALESAWRRRAA